MIHATAIVDPRASVADGVSIGPWSIIGADVEIGEDTEVGSHVNIQGPTRIGAKNRIYPFNSIGEIPQDKKFAGENTRLEIGDGNVIRENCTFNRGTGTGGGVTRIGQHNWFMAYCHIAHDCLVEDDVTMANGSTLAGHVEVASQVTLGAFTVVHQFCRIGEQAFSAMGSVIFKDVPPFMTVSGVTAVPHGLNSEGLRRRAYPEETQRALKRAYKVIYKQGLTLNNALEELDSMARECSEIALIADFIRGTKRGIVR